MELQIITPLNVAQHEIAWIEFNTNVGNFVIQEGYTPTLLVLKPNDVCVFRTQDGKQETIKVSYGTAEITRKKVTVILQS